MASAHGTVDINLTALISSVERDIWLLEQLESNSNRRRRNFPTDELPFPITEEILNLPGYKPKVRSQQLSDVPKEEDERLNDVQLAKPSRLPTLPPKVRNENSPKIGDLIHQRLLPRDNCVTNILYSRRLPSPPVYRRPAASPAERNHHFSQDDQFREKKYDSDEEESPNLFCPLCAQKFGYSFGLECHLLSVHRDDLRNQVTMIPIQVSDLERCPKCRAQFFGEGVLVKHLISSHKDFVVKSVLLDGGDSLSKRYLECRFCGQHFMRRHLKLFTIHVEQKHETELQHYLHREATKFSASDLVGFGESSDQATTEVALIMTLLRTVSFPTTQTSVINHDSENEKRKKKTQVNQTQTLASSLRRKRSSSQPATRTLPRLPSSSGKQSLETDHQFIPGELSPLLAINNLIREGSKKYPHHHHPLTNEDPQNLHQTSKPEGIRHPVNTRTSTNHRENEIPLLPAKNKMAHLQQRRLMLSTYRHVPQPEPPPSPLPALLGFTDDIGAAACCVGEDDPDRRISCYASSSSESSHSNSVDLDPLWTSVMRRHPQDRNLFKCNLCEMSFAENAFLLTHLKNNHRSNMTKALRPHFSCGACPAKFFKNSFLVKHCQHHINTDKLRQ